MIYEVDFGGPALNIGATTTLSLGGFFFSSADDVETMASPHKALHFWKTGVDIDLPFGVAEVYLRVYSGAGDLRADGLDANGKVVASQTVAAGGIIRPITLTTAEGPITKVHVGEAGNEGFLVLIRISD